MKPLALNLSKMKKIAGDDSSSTFLHPAGHHMVIAHHAVSALQRKQLEKMPVHKFAEGGGVVDKSGDIHPYDAITSGLQQGGSQEAYDQSMASLPKTPVDEATPTPDANPTQSAPMQNDQMADQLIAPSTGQSQDPYNPGVSAVPSSALDNQEKTIKNAMGAEQAAAKNIANTWKDYNTENQKIVPVENLLAAQKLADDTYRDHFAAEKINPDRVYQNMDTGKKISSALGMIFGGIGQGLIGGPNHAVNAINKAIENDIDAQKNDQSKTMNLWKMNREATQNDIQANLLTRNQLLSATEAKIKMFQAQSGSAEAALRFAAPLLALEHEKENNRILSAISHPVEKTGLIGIDPSVLVPRLVPPAHQATAFKEVAQAQNAAQNESKINDLFEQAIKENTAFKTGLGIRTPPSVKALEAMFDPLIHDNEGRINELEQKHVQQLIPSQFDLDSTTETKRAALKSFMDQKKSAPTAKAYGIDLDRFASTRPNQNSPVITKTMNGIPYVKVPGGWKAAR